VLFMREAVAWDGSRDLLGFGAALALVIAALSLYLAVKGKH
ncbi:MAG: YqhA family protein, partial [Proteobacteria bacterium]|nr:YqhA family protein [Pseudomonadota bacterium]